MAVVDDKTSENYALLPESDATTHENHTKWLLNDALMIKYNEIMAENDEKSAAGKIVINHLTIRIS